MPEEGVLYRVLAEHLETFLDRAGERLPGFVARELRKYLHCGILAGGFARVHCSGCGRDELVACSCKGRAFCPICGGRRMADLAAQLCDRVLPDVPVRQWVLSFPWKIRFLLAYDPELQKQVRRIFVSTVLRWLEKRARGQGIVRSGGTEQRSRGLLTFKRAKLLLPWKAPTTGPHDRGPPSPPVHRATPSSRRLAAVYLHQSKPGSTLQPTALVHEAWVKLAEHEGPSIGDKEHFMALAATVMRQLLVDHAREKDTLKRGGGWSRVTLSDSDSAARAEDVHAVDLVALDAALGKLAELNPERAKLVELRYFGGSTLEQAATILGNSRSEAARRWRTARAWLASEIRNGTGR